MILNLYFLHFCGSSINSVFQEMYDLVWPCLYWSFRAKTYRATNFGKNYNWRLSVKAVFLKLCVNCSIFIMISTAPLFDFHSTLTNSFTKRPYATVSRQKHKTPTNQEQQRKKPSFRQRSACKLPRYRFSNYPPWLILLHFQPSLSGIGHFPNSSAWTAICRRLFQIASVPYAGQLSEWVCRHAY